MTAEEPRAVDVTAVFYIGKPPRPWRFRITDEEGERRAVQVDRVITVDERRLYHLVRGYEYLCRCGISGRYRELNLAYSIEDATWWYRGSRRDR
ncbi:MAG: hypothetical protein IJH75_02150 [Mogibacterium sp.]|nr:hypothetical protein [Mogibacterium sp.]